MLRHPLQPLLRPPLVPLMAPTADRRTPTQRALAILKRYGSTAEGVWYDPSDFERYMAVGPELVVNGDGGSISGWQKNTANLTTDGEKFFLENVGGTGAIAGRSFATVIGRSYVLSGGLRVGASGYAVYLTAGPMLGSFDKFTNTASTTLTPVSFIYVATATTTFVSVAVNSGSGFSTYFDNISVRELTAIGTATMFQDAAGTIPVTAVEQPVGLILDKSKGLVLGPELVSNGGFDSDSTWVKDAYSTIAGGVLTATSSPSNSRPITGYVPLVNGKSYIAQYTVTSITNNVSLNFTGNVGAVVSSPGTYTSIFTAAGTLVELQSRLGVTLSCVIDNISVRELPGNHASQTVSTKRPTLRRGIQNLLTYSGDFSNAAWMKTDIGAASWSVGASVADPFGGNTAVTVPLTSGRFFRVSNFAIAAGTTVTQALWVKRSASGGSNNIRLTTNNTLAWNTGMSTKFALTDEWQLVLQTGVAQTGFTAAHIIFGTVNGGGTVDADCVGNVDIYRAALFAGTYTAAQVQALGGIPLTTTAPANTALGDYFLQFDGVDDALVTPSIDFTATDKMTVVAGVRYLDTSKDAVMLELSSNWDVTPGSFVGPNPSSGAIKSGSRGAGVNTAMQILSAPATAPKSVVATSAYAIQSDYSVLRLDGALVATNLVDKGTGNFTLNPLYIGSRAGTSLPFNGNLHQLAIFGAALTSAELAIVERYVGRKTGITL